MYKDPSYLWYGWWQYIIQGLQGVAGRVHKRRAQKTVSITNIVFRWNPQFYSISQIQQMMDEYPEDQPNKLAERQPNHVSNTHRHLVNTSAGTMQMNSGIMVAQLWIWLMGEHRVVGDMFVTEMMTAIVYICLFFLIKKTPYCIYFYMCIECLHVTCRRCLSVFIYASFFVSEAHSVCSYPFILHSFMHVWLCKSASLHICVHICFVSIYSERTFCAFSLCMCVHVLPPADSPHLCLTAWQIYITELTCWHAGGMKDNYRYCHGNCGPAVTRDLQCHDAVYAWVCVCVFVCAKVYVFVCERDGVGGSCCLQGLDVLFQRYSLRHSG